MDLALAAAVVVLGLLAGDVANRVISGLSADEPAGACRCERGADLPGGLPLLSWLAAAGRCRRCARAVSVRHPGVEAATAVAFGLVAVRVGWDWALPAYLLFAWTLLVISVIDLRSRRIPNRLTYPLTPALLALLALAAVLHGEPLWAVRAVAGGAVAFGALLVMALATPGGMGMGDVKLAAFVGVGLAYLGWPSLLLGILAAFLLGGVVALALLLARLRGRRDLIPFGPYLAAGALIALLVGPQPGDGTSAPTAAPGAVVAQARPGALGCPLGRPGTVQRRCDGNGLQVAAAGW